MNADSKKEEKKVTTIEDKKVTTIEDKKQTITIKHTEGETKLDKPAKKVAILGTPYFLWLMRKSGKKVN